MRAGAILLVAASALAVLPAAAGHVVTCAAHLDTPSAAPEAVARGDRLTVAARVLDLNPVPDAPGTNQARLLVTVAWSDGTIGLLTDIGPRDVPGTFAAGLVVPPDAPLGVGNATFELLDPEAGVLDPDFPNWCLKSALGATVSSVLFEVLG